MGFTLYFFLLILLILSFLGTRSFILFDSLYMSPAVVAASFHSDDVVL
jgi:hypothetical protein